MGVVRMSSTDLTADQLTRALGEAVIRIWSNLPQDVQNHLFQEAVLSENSIRLGIRVSGEALPWRGSFWPALVRDCAMVPA